jgi:glutathione S-transferase
MIKLYGLHYSPFTHRARWSLELCSLPHTYVEYLPNLGEPALRLRMRRWRGPVSVPVLFASGDLVDGSAAIVRFAARSSGGDRLGDVAAAAYWEALADRAICEGRGRLVQRLLQSAAAQEEAMDGVVPRPLQPSLRWLARDTMRGLLRKYGPLIVEGSMREALLQARRQLGRGRYLLGSFSYADIALSTCLEMVAPRVQRGPHTREAWTWDVLAREFADVVAWRDALIAAQGPRFLQPRELPAPSEQASPEVTLEA